MGALMPNFVRDNTRSIGAHLTTTSAVTLVTGVGYIQLLGVKVANISTDTRHISLSLFSDADSDTYKLIHQRDVPPNNAVWLPLDGISLSTDDELRATAEAANKFDVVTVIAEQPGRHI